jgi:hypothetical protein
MNHTFKFPLLSLIGMIVAWPIIYLEKILALVMACICSGIRRGASSLERTGVKSRVYFPASTKPHLQPSSLSTSTSAQTNANLSTRYLKLNRTPFDKAAITCLTVSWQNIRLPQPLVPIPLTTTCEPRINMTSTQGAPPSPTQSRTKKVMLVTGKKRII